MAQLLEDEIGRPKPQLEKPDGTGFEAWKGENNAGRITGDVDHDTTDSGKPVKIGGRAATSIPTAVDNGDRVNAFFDENGRLVVKIDLPLPAGTNNIGKVDLGSAIPAGTNAIGKVSIDQATPGTTNGVQVVAALPAGTNNIGDIDVLTTPADATPGAAHPSKGFLMIGSDGTNAQRLKVDTDGHQQVDVLSSALPTGAATEAKQDTGNTALTAIKDTDGIKKITDTVTIKADTAANQANDLKVTLDGETIDVNTLTTPADATPGAAPPAKGFLVAGSDGTNAQRLKVDTDGHVQIDVLSSELPTGAATEAKQDTIIEHVDGLETTLTAIKDTDGIKKIADPVKLAYENLTILASEARTTSGTSSEFTVGNYKEASFFLNVTAASGTTPTLDVTIQTKDPVSSEWFDIVTFTQATGITKERKADKNTDIGSVIRANYTIGGTTPSITFSLGAVVK